MRSTQVTQDAVVIDKGTEDELWCVGYRDNWLKRALLYVLSVITLGIPLLVLHWKPDWAVKLKKTQCPLREANTVLLKDTYGQLHTQDVTVKEVTAGRIVAGYSCDDSDISSVQSDDDTVALTTNTQEKCYLRYFEHSHMRYIWYRGSMVFSAIRGLESDTTCAMIHEEFTGLNEVEQLQKQELFGENSIDIKVKSYSRLFIEEVLNPFYIFQICSVILWSLDDYYIYASCIVVISSISLVVSLYETRKQSQTLRDMVSSSSTTIQVMSSSGELVVTPTSQLVPGAVILIPTQGCMMSCDAVLVSGNTIVNESMLTGESVPVTKTPLAPSEANEVYSPEIHKRHTLFSGTQVIQTRYYGDSKVKAIVVRTGFSTAKGELVRSILFPKPIGFKFYQDAMKFILFLCCIATFGMIYSITMLLIQGVHVSKVILRALDIITVVVPPALPAAMTVGTVYAQNRLKKAGIFCISPPRINICGKLKLICFDKTGTLTEEGLDMWGVTNIQDNNFLPVIQDPSVLPSHSPFAIAMATCHSLTIIDGEIVGDPLDLKMFHSINWIMEEPGKDTTKFDSLIPTVVHPVSMDTYYSAAPDKVAYEVGIVRQFTFSSTLQRMSVIARVLGASHMNAYAKGAPEKIASLCRPDTIPDDFHAVLHNYTRRGFRVIALAWKALDEKVNWHQAQRISRNSVECDMSLLGLLILENMLKPQTTPVIHQLKDADIRTVMVTGDNILTAVSVARQCGMVAPRESIVLASAYAPDDGKPALIEWKNIGDEDMEGESVEDVDRDQCLVNELRETESSFSTPRLTYQSAYVEVTKPRYHFALSGRSFAVILQHFPDLLQKICVRGTVFARMSPNQKSQLVEHLQALGYCVGMCGDGANDCGALKMAHAGISLSEAEASVASPFTSRTANIECVPIVVREGRAALVTSFGVFKYMALYSMIQFVSMLILYTVSFYVIQFVSLHILYSVRLGVILCQMTQFVSLLILYTKGCNLGDWMFLYIDLVITTTVAVLMGHTGAYESLVAKRPPGSLVAPKTVLSIIIHIAMVAVFQAAAYFYLTYQPWFTPAAHSVTATNVHSWETAVIFYVSCFQYLMLAFCFSKGPPYRRPIWTNVLFLLALIILTSFSFLLLLHPFSFLAHLLQLKLIPDFMFQLKLCGIIAFNFLCAFIVESVFIPSTWFSRFINKIRRKKLAKNKYKIIEQKLSEDSDWPPLGGITMATEVSATNIQQAYISS
ncbi:putative cation-transporting ATPase 13A3 [Lamellibrachia satsuma]|nr:putative cation-transporting ATPase 13A3 [Lamellibrachia satsuma]